MAELEEITESYNRTDLWLQYSISNEAIKGLSLRVFVNNVGDQEIRHHSSFLKEESPEAGRSGGVSLHYSF